MAIEHSSVVSSLSDFFILFKNNSSVFKFCKTFLNLVKSYFKYYVYSLLLFVNLSNTFLFEIFSYIFGLIKSILAVVHISILKQFCKIFTFSFCWKKTEVNKWFQLQLVART